MKIDLNTVVIPRERRIWVVHPGKNKKFFADFEATNRIYLEYPGLDLTEKVLEDDHELRTRIKYSLETVHYNGLTRPNGSTISKSDFDGDAETNVAVYLRTVRHLFGNMADGDLVIVPGWGAYSRVLFGEVVGNVNFNLKDRIYPNMFADTQFRNVRWLSQDRTKSELGDLVKFVNKPPAIAEVARDQNTDRFFDYAYKAYVMDGSSWSTITAPNYRGDDPGAIADSVRLIEIAVASFRALEQGASLSGLSVDQIIDKFYSKEDIEYFGMRYASPGRLDFKARNTAMSIYVATFIALASAGGLTGCKATAQPAVVENTQTRSPQLNKQVGDQVTVFVSQVSDPTVRQIESMGTNAHNKTGLKSPVKVTP